MPTQNVNLTPELDSFVKAQVASGYFNDSSEVHRAALAAMAKVEEEREAKLQVLRREVSLGVDDLESGRFVEVSSEDDHRAFFDGIRAKAAEASGNS